MTWLAADALSSPVLVAAVSAMVGGGFFGGLVALLRVRVDRDRIVVDAAQGAVVVQSSVIKDLQEEGARRQEENVRLRLRIEEADRRDAERVAQIRQLRAELVALRARVEAVEDGPG